MRMTKLGGYAVGTLQPPTVRIKKTIEPKSAGVIRNQALDLNPKISAFSEPVSALTIRALPNLSPELGLPEWVANIRHTVYSHG